MLKKIPLDKINGTKNALFLLSWVPTHHSFNLQFLYELKHKVRLSKTLCGFSIFDSASFLLKFILFFKKNYELFDFKTSLILSKLKNREATHSFVPRHLIFKSQQEVLKFNDTCAKQSSPKTDLETNFLNLENQSFENISFSQQ